VRVRVDSLLMEGARRIDEWTRLESRVPSPDAVPVLAAGETSARPIDLRPEEWEVLAEVDGERDLRHIASDLGRSAFDVAKIVYGLVGMNLVRSARAPQPRTRRSSPLLDELELMLADGELEGPSARARELQKAYPDRAELPLVAGRALAAQGRIRAAAESFDRAVTLDPLSLDAHYQSRAWPPSRTGDLDRAAGGLEDVPAPRPGGDRRTRGARPSPP
jgi:tetratricopeptide (TPR) repeat protein